MASKKIKIKKPSKVLKQIEAEADAIDHAKSEREEFKASTLIGANVNLRSSKENDALIMKIVKKGTVVELLETDGEWHRIKVDGMTGWIYGRHVHIKS